MANPPPACPPENVKARDANGKPICGAKTKRKGTPCPTPPMFNGRCRIHGGKTPGGIASPNFKHGRLSKYLPTKLAEQYQIAMADGNLLELREDLSLLDARLAQVLAGLPTGEQGASWRQAQTVFAQFKVARAAGSSDAEPLLEQLGQVLQTGTGETAAWQEITAVLEQRRKTVESERRRLVDMQQMITAEKAMLLMAAVADIIRRHVTDPHQLAEIATDLNRLVAHNAGQQHHAR